MAADKKVVVYEHVRGAFTEYRLYKYWLRHGQKVKYRHNRPKFMLTLWGKATDKTIRQHLGLSKYQIQIIRDKKQPLKRPKS